MVVRAIQQRGIVVASMQVTQEITSAETSRYVKVHDVGNSKKHTVKTLN